MTYPQNSPASAQLMTQIQANMVKLEALNASMMPSCEVVQCKRELALATSRLALALGNEFRKEITRVKQ